MTLSVDCLGKAGWLRAQGAHTCGYTPGEGLVFPWMHVATGLGETLDLSTMASARKGGRHMFYVPADIYLVLKLTFILLFSFAHSPPTPGTKWSLFQCDLKLSFLFPSLGPSRCLVCSWPCSHICLPLSGPLAEGIPSYFSKLFVYLSLWGGCSGKKKSKHHWTRSQTLLLISS